MAKQKVSAALPQAVPQPAPPAPTPHEAPTLESHGYTVGALGVAIGPNAADTAFRVPAGAVVTNPTTGEYTHPAPSPSPDPGAQSGASSVPADGEAR